MATDSRTRSLSDTQGKSKDSRWSGLGRTALYPLIALVMTIAIWAGIVAVFDFSPIVLPAPATVLEVLIDDWASLVDHTGFTAIEVALGFLLSVTVGIPVGMLIVFLPTFRSAFYPLLVASQMIPKVAVAPIFLIWFGLGITSKIVVAFAVAVFAVVIATIQGFEAVDNDRLRLFRSMGASNWHTFVKLRVPTALPALFTGLKVAMTLAVVGAMVGEFVAANKGIGFYILFANGTLNTPAVYAGLVFAAAMGVAFYFLVELSEYLVMARPRSTQDTTRLSVE